MESLASNTPKAGLGRKKRGGVPYLDASLETSGLCELTENGCTSCVNPPPELSKHQITARFWGYHGFDQRGCTRAKYLFVLVIGDKNLASQQIFLGKLAPIFRMLRLQWTETRNGLYGVAKSNTLCFWDVTRNMHLAWDGEHQMSSQLNVHPALIIVVSRYSIPPRSHRVKPVFSPRWECNDRLGGIEAHSFLLSDH
ncbi:hypothetical protein CPSG_01406 [Coccidioides posadasii str. Silveira]|uniref:Uncharacterized protein n=1 Tax=Coccidioides posadasii (strain RMSCC 757 / Silveira) TaxID=443226 RepID=E9CVB1_COCPS|nr:hypothetical protein CPSG_01406 [Coccidioides posadasii str. Silveira]